MECIPSKKHICKHCNKEYSTRQNLWKHNNSVHNATLSNNVKNVSKKINNPEKSVKKVSNKIVCKKCNKEFNSRQAKWSHDKKCIFTNIQEDILNSNNILIKQNEELKQQNEKFEKELIEMKKQMLEIMNKQNKIHPKTLTKINNQLNDNKVINNINIIQLGGESVDTLFNKNQQIDVLNKRYKCLEFLVKQIHFNDNYPQFKNILITNTQNNIAYRYDKVENKFMATNKNELLDEVITERMGDIENFYDNQGNYLSPKTKKVIDDFISKMAEKDKKYYEDKMKDIKLVIYNNRNKVSKEITQDLEIIL